jgi:hypothetical protein
MSRYFGRHVGRKHRSSPLSNAQRQRVHPICPICDKPISLEQLKTGEYGHVLHEQCYVLRLQLCEATRKNREMATAHSTEIDRSTVKQLADQFILAHHEKPQSTSIFSAKKLS